MLSQRVSKARQIANANLVKQMNKRAWLVPGSEGKQYLVTRRKGTNQYRCVLDCGRYGSTDCRGNSNGYICYHIVTAIIFAAQKAGRKVAFCESENDAQLLSRLGGNLYKIHSGQGSGKLWVVVS